MSIGLVMETDITILEHLQNLDTPYVFSPIHLMS